MRVRLDQVREHPVTWDEELLIELAELGGEGMLDLGPIRCRGEVGRVEGLGGGGVAGAEQGFLFRAHLEYCQTLSCFRCLEPTLQEAVYDFEILLVAELQVAEPAELELDQDDLDVLRVTGEELDTEELVHEQVRLNLPMKPLCFVDCRGLCTQCGSNLNSDTCRCPPLQVDSRWAGLAALRDRFPDPGDSSADD